MPIFQDDQLDQFRAAGSGFRFSGAKINQLGASEYTLFGLAVDVSGSVASFQRELEACLKTTLEGCQRSPRVDNLLVRLVTFDSRVQEQHGFRPLADCHVASYQGVIQPGGLTSLYDAAVDVADSLATYGRELIAQDYQANGILVVVTDGLDNESTMTARGVKEAVARARMGESLESLVTILIGVNVTDPAVSAELAKFRADGGFDQYVEVQDATPKSFAKLANFISKSVSSQSQSLGSKAASQPITF